MNTASELTARRRWLIVERQDPLPCCSGPAIYDISSTSVLVDVSTNATSLVSYATVSPTVNGYIAATGTAVVTDGSGEIITLSLRYDGPGPEQTIATKTFTLPIGYDPQVLTVSGVSGSVTAGSSYIVYLYVKTNVFGPQVAGSISALANITEAS